MDAGSSDSSQDSSSATTTISIGGQQYQAGVLMFYNYYAYNLLFLRNNGIL